MYEQIFTAPKPNPIPETEKQQRLSVKAAKKQGNRFSGTKVYGTIMATRVIISKEAHCTKRTVSGWTGFGQQKEPRKQKRKPGCTATHQAGNSKGCVKICVGEQLRKGMKTTQPKVTIMF